MDFVYFLYHFFTTQIYFSFHLFIELVNFRVDLYIALDDSEFVRFNLTLIGHEMLIYIHVKCLMYMAIRHTLRY